MPTGRERADDGRDLGRERRALKREPGGSRDQGEAERADEARGARQVSRRLANGVIDRVKHQQGEHEQIGLVGREQLEQASSVSMWTPLSVGASIATSERGCVRVVGRPCGRPPHF